MKKTYSKIFLGIVIGILVVSPGVVFADPAPASAPAAAPVPPQPSNADIAKGTGIGCGGGALLGAGIGAFAGPAGAAIGAGAGCLGGGLLGYLFSSGNLTWLILRIGIIIANIIFGILVWILSLVGTLFDYTVTQLVINMGGYVNGSAAAGVQDAWKIMRDLANIALIGGLVATAIGTILQLANYNANKFLARIIIAAILVNFSYFFAGAIIDASNYVAAQVYSNLILSSQSCSNCGIAARFQNLAPIENIDTKQNQKALTNAAGGSANETPKGDTRTTAEEFTYEVALIVLILITIFIFLSITALLIGRFVALIFLLITSPIGIAGLAVPGVQKYSQEWWSILIAQAFFAPVFFLLAGFSLNIIEQSKATLLGLNGAQDPTGVVGIILTFIVSAAFMFASLRFAKQISETGSKYLGDVYKGATGLTGWMPKLYTGTLKYLGGSAGTLTIGAAAYKFGHGYERLAAKARLDKIPLIATVDRGVQKGFKKLTEAKFGGKQSYAETKVAREERTTRLSNVKEYEEKKDAALKKNGLVDQNEDAKKARDAVLKEWGDASKYREKGKLPENWDKMSDEERASWIKQQRKDGKWDGKLWVQDKDGKWDWEDDWEYRDWLDRKRKFSIQARDKKTGKVENQQLSYQDTLDSLRQEFADVPPDLLKEDYKRGGADRKRFLNLKNAFSSEVTMDILKDKTIDKATRDSIRKSRTGDLLKGIKEFDARVISVDTKEDIAKGVADGYLTADGELTEKGRRDGMIIRYSKEYHSGRRFYHEHMKKNGNADELEDYVTSDPGIADGLQENETFNNAITDDLFIRLQKNAKISAGRKRILRGLKRNELSSALEMDETATEIFNRRKIDGKDITQEQRDDLALASDFYGVDDKTFNEAFEKDPRLKSLTQPEIDRLRNARTILQGDTELREAAQLRQRAEIRSDYWLSRKADMEAQNEIKQEMLGSRLVGKYMRVGQVRTINKDQAFMDAQGLSMLINGDERKINWLLNNTDAQTKYGISVDTIARANRERTRLGMSTVEAAARSRIEEIAERNEQAIGETTLTPTRPITVGTRIQKTMADRHAPAPATEEETATRAREEEVLPELIDNLEPYEAPSLVRGLSDEDLQDPRIATGLDKRHLDAIYNAVPKTKLKAIINSLLAAAANPRTPLHPSAVVWLGEMFRDGHLTEQQAAEYQRLFGNKNQQ